jgi:iron complex outermembrane receptor protein
MFRHSALHLAALATLGTYGTLVVGEAHATDALAPITVTGSAIDDRFGTVATDPVSSVTFSRQQVEDQHAKNLIEVLRSVSGVTADLSGDGETIKIKLRGVENQRYMGEKPGVAIVVDGVPVFERTGKVNIDLDNIESIKVIKGGASYLYGEDALAGAVIITTKRGASQKGFKLETDAGPYAYRRYLLRAGFAKDDLTGHLQYSDRGQDGYYYLSATSNKTWSGNLKYAFSGSSDLAFGFEKSKRFRDREGAVTGVTQASNDPRGFLAGRGFSRNFNVDLSRYNLTYSNDLDERSNLLAVLYQYRDYTTFWSSPMRFTASGTPTQSVNDYSTLNDYEQVQRGVKTEYRTQWDDWAVMGGVELKRNTFDNLQTALKDYRTRPAGPTIPAGMVMSDDYTVETTQALYGEVKYSLTTHTVLTTNLRHDRLKVDFSAKPVAGNGNRTVKESKDFDVSSYRVGLTHALSANTSMYGSVSTGFRAPTAEQLYRGQTTTNALVQSNPDLRPEKATSTELGVRHQGTLAGWPSSVKAALFQVDRKDFILDSNGQYATSNNPLGGGSQFRNIGGARSRGLELEARTQPAKDWSFDLAYTYLDAKFTRYDSFYQSLGNPNGTFVANPTPAQRNNPAFWQSNFTVVQYNNTGKKLPRTPPHLLNLRANYVPAPGWTVSAELDYKATAWADEINQEKWPGRTVMHLMAQYSSKLSGWPGTRLKAFVRVDNLFNKRYYLTARGTNDSNYDGRYDSEDPSIVVDPGRMWRVGISLQF